MKYYSVLYFMFVIFFLLNAVNSTPSVTTTYGLVQGFVNTSYHGQPYMAFEGIPFAKPPLGALRFEPPQLPNPWNNILLATKKRSACSQYRYQSFSSKANPLMGSEDCLYLNIYVPQRKSHYNIETFPVIIWFYGGAFQFGSADEATEKYIMDKDVILVTLNYRLGPLGFLSTEDHVVPGNMGLKDQNAAIRWVKSNIERFGGNPNNIILSGVSAGGASTHYHFLSPMSAGLFHGGISVSGTALANWALTENPLDKAKKMASLVGCPTQNNKEMVNCLKKIPAENITNTIPHSIGWNYDPYTPFGPVVEKGGSNPFIAAPPAQLLADGKVQNVPWVTGVTLDEGLWTSAFFITNDTKLKELNDNWDDILPSLLDYNDTIPTSKHKYVANRIRQEYFGALPINKETRDRVVRMQGDREFKVSAEKAARMQAAKNSAPVWFWLYAYRANNSLSEFLADKKEFLGISHCDDVIQYIMYIPKHDPTTTESDRKFQSEVLTFWETFAYKKRVDLDTQWKPVDPNSSKLNYQITHGPGNYEMVADDNFGNKRFWDTIDFNENKVF